MAGEKRDSRASLLFGRCFEKALAAFFSGEDSTAALFKEWGTYQDAQLEYSRGDDWERMLRQGVRCWNDWLRMIAFALISLTTICRCKSWFDLFRSRNDFVSYIDAVGTWTG